MRGHRRAVAHRAAATPAATAAAPIAPVAAASAKPAAKPTQPVLLASNDPFSSLR